MQQIADRANVSRGAVSAALNNNPGIRVSPATKLKILRIAKELNYRPDFAATALKTGRTGLLGFICGGLKLPFFAELTDCLMEVANRNGYQLMIMPISWKQHTNIECFLKMFDMADGIFIASALLPESSMYQQIIIEHQKPFILMNYKLEGLSSVTFDFHDGMDKAFKILLKNGHKTIAHSREHDDIWKHEAYMDCCRKYGIEPIEYLYDLNVGFDSIIECGVEIARNKSRHSALVVSDYGLSIMIHGFEQLNLRIPEDISLLAFASKTTPIRLFRPGMSTVELDCESMARNGMKLMKSFLTDRSTKPRVENIIIQPEVIIRQSICNLQT